MLNKLIELENVLRSMTFEACPCGCGQSIHFNIAEGNDKLHHALTIIHDLQQSQRNNRPRGRAQRFTIQVAPVGVGSPYDTYHIVDSEAFSRSRGRFVAEVWDRQTAEFIADVLNNGYSQHQLQ